MVRALEINGTILGWHDDKEFEKLAKTLHLISASPIYKLHLLWESVPHLRGLEGLVAEVGVWKGGSAKLLLERMKRLGITDTLYLFDTFSGMPACDPNVDCHREGDFKDTSIPIVKERLTGYTNFECIPGFFPNSAKGRFDNEKFKWMHIDVDIYSSVKEACEWAYSRMVTGGLMIFDDYGTHACKGAKLAVDEFFADKTEAVMYLPTTQAIVIKH